MKKLLARLSLVRAVWIDSAGWEISESAARVSFGATPASPGEGSRSEDAPTFGIDSRDLMRGDEFAGLTVFGFNSCRSKIYCRMGGRCYTVSHVLATGLVQRHGVTRPEAVRAR